jgi:hypothetical protein
VLAAGARWKVIAVVTALALSGAGLTAVELTAADAPDGLWTVLVALKGGVLVAAVAVFVNVSWRLWPARAKAHALGSPELAFLQRRFAVLAVVLAALVAAGLTLGAMADSLD